MRNESRPVSRSLVSIIMPCYNEADGLQQTLDRISADLVPTSTEDYEFILVDDHSLDDSPRILEEWSRRCRRARVIRLATNCGSHVAGRAGLEFCKGDVAVFLTADLQEGIEMVPRVLEQWRTGADMVYSIAESRDRGSMFSDLGARSFYVIAKLFGNLTHKSDMRAGLRLIDRCAIDFYCRYAPRSHNMSLWTLQQPFSRAYVNYTPYPRRFGNSKWTLHKKLKLTLNSLMDVAPVFLTGWVALGALLVGFGILGGLVLIARFAMYSSSNPSTADMGVIVLAIWSSAAIVGGLICIAIGALGCYLWRLYDGLRNSGPEFTVEWTSDAYSSVESKVK